MNYSVDGLRKAYQKTREEEKKKVSDDVLRSLGYSELEIAMSQK